MWALGKARVSCHGTDIMDASLPKRKFKKKIKRVEEKPCNVTSDAFEALHPAILSDGHRA